MAVSPSIPATTAAPTTVAADLRDRSRRRVPRLMAAAVALSMTYTVVATLRHTAPPDFDATTPTVWVGYLLVVAVTVVAVLDGTWARMTVALGLGAFLVAAVLVYPGYFTAPYQDTMGWFENNAYVALLAIALHEHLGRR